MSNEKQKLKIILSEPRGFCAGVERAIETVKKTIEKYGAPVYVRHEIVHNKHVLEELKALGAVFVESLNQAPDDRPIIFSAHGVAKEIPLEAKRREMIAIDATCPLVSKVHREAEAHYRRGYKIIMIGHKNHAEVIGTMGQLPKGAISLIEKKEDIAKLGLKPSENIAYITQTTLSIDDTKEIINELKKTFPNIKTPKKEDICYATTNRQTAVKMAATKAELFIIIGSKNSSNSQRLVEVAKNNGCPRAMLIDSVQEINWDDIKNIKTLAISAGASAPEILVKEVLARAEEIFNLEIEKISTATEDIVFKIPLSLTR